MNMIRNKKRIKGKRMEKQYKIDLHDRDFLIALRGQAENEAYCKDIDPTWSRAFLDLADAADHLDGMNARCIIDIKTGKNPIRVVLIDSQKEKL